jgi:ADP-heptose:LPS heptosyltransferase
LNEKYPFFSELYKLEIYTDELEKKYITDLLFRYKLEPKKIVLISPGSTRPSKLWQPEKYAQVINKLSEKGYSVILTGTKSDTIISEIIKYTNRHLIILTELNLKQYAELIKNSILFIGSDSGGFYISIACNVNSVCLFGSTDPEKYGPFDKERQKIIYKKLNCSPCYKKICPKTKKSFLTPCMEKITVDDILTAINNYIEI